MKHAPPADLATAPPLRSVVPLAEREENGEWTLQLRIPPELAYFAGHFPAAPVLPGVVQVAWALELAAARLGTPNACRNMEALKFQHVLRPGDRVDLTLHWDAARGKLHFAYRLGEHSYSSGRLVLRPMPTDMHE
ncbi:acyl-CoA synthetase [Dyella silvatica]|uniref:ApeI family dehydratase n=1 Tax=Dyella silvatica TaxID=2992128 RepID=UPI00225AF46B|nr:acyl-CoA synthetase [Dyella silvatica]